MPICGYKKMTDTEEPELRLSEVSFKLSPADLRRIARFLTARADEIERGTFIDGGRHLRDYDKSWSVENCGGDVIVVPP
jgi:hypothetical protein